ncbi:hypothetical protein H4S08_004085, partial [Coemansia sp. RSA 1365]
QQHKLPITPASSAALVAHDMGKLTEALSCWSLSMLTVPQSESNSLKIQLLYDKVALPIKAHDNNARFDVSCDEPIDIALKTQVTVLIGFTAKALKGTLLKLVPLSELANKGVVLLGSTVDAGYLSKIKVILLKT